LPLASPDLFRICSRKKRGEANETLATRQLVFATRVSNGTTKGAENGGSASDCYHASNCQQVGELKPSQTRTSAACGVREIARLRIGTWFREELLLPGHEPSEVAVELDPWMLSINLLPPKPRQMHHREPARLINVLEENVVSTATRSNQFASSTKEQMTRWQFAEEFGVQ
jgi:hypothetical protein